MPAPHRDEKTLSDLGAQGPGNVPWPFLLAVVLAAGAFLWSWRYAWDRSDRKGRAGSPDELPRPGDAGTVLLTVDLDPPAALAVAVRAERSMGAHEVIRTDNLVARGWIGTGTRFRIPLQPRRTEYELGAVPVRSVNAQTTLLCYARPRLTMAPVDGAYVTSLASTLADRIAGVASHPE